jgi:predicted PhzF superfamily epimerase YddE/YHI9
MDFPSTPAAACAAPVGLIEALGAQSAIVARSAFDYLVELPDEAAVRSLQPDFRRLGQINTRGVIVTSRAADFDFISRFFAPAAGIDEDPVTGSTHCSLAPWWADKLNKTTFRAFQASARGGEVGLRLAGDRVNISGSAVTTLRGVFV